MNIWKIPENEDTLKYVNKKIREVAGSTGMLETAYSWFRAGVMLTYLKEGAFEDKSKSANVTFEKIVENMQKTIFFEENYDAQRRILAELLDMGEIPDLDVSFSHIMFDEIYALEEEAGLTHYRGKIFVENGGMVEDEFVFGNHAFRKFETITGVDVQLPKRRTSRSAGNVIKLRKSVR